MKTILIVEDDAVLCEGLCRALRTEDWNTVGAGSLREARKRIGEADCMILDGNLPDGNGFDFCREVLGTRRLPVLFLTVRDSEADEVAGLRAGACDYMKKPFSLMVLRERVGKLLRSSDGGEVRYEAGRYRFRFDTLAFTVDGRPVILSASEARLLSVLVKNAGRVVNRSALIDALWDCGEDGVSENALSVTVKRLRDKLGGGAIRTVYGLGYVWKGDEA
ncbi:MAG: response regulator transcription factor [Clostridiales bacterium]|nr:response regulator transcription factor [Clostridiales bacterium]